MHYNSFMLHGSKYEVGDYALVPEADRPGCHWVARILDAWQDHDTPMFAGQWLWSKDAAMTAIEARGTPPPKHWPRFRQGELYYSENTDDNVIEVIARKCTVVPKHHIRNQVKKYSAKQDHFWFEYMFDDGTLAKVVP